MRHHGISWIPWYSMAAGMWYTIGRIQGYVWYTMVVHHGIHHGDTLGYQAIEVYHGIPWYRDGIPWYTRS